MQINSYKNQIEQILDKRGAHAETTEDTRGIMYRIKSNEATLVITIGEEWLGYDLEIHKDVFGKSFGTAEDTDNYPLEGEFVQEIFSDIKVCLEAFLDHKVYLSKDRKKPMLAVPQSKNNFKLVRRKLFGGVTRELPADSVSLSEYRPLR